MKPTTFDQIQALWMLIWKFLRSNLENLDGTRVQEAIRKKDHPFWAKFGDMLDTLRKLSLAKMVLAGNYDEVNSDITEKNFPMPKDFVLGVDPKLFQFERVDSSESERVTAAMDKEGYRPATIFDLLDFGVRNPKEQRKYSIIALGSVAKIDGEPNVVTSQCVDCELSLSLEHFESGWDKCNRFLGVRK